MQKGNNFVGSIFYSVLMLLEVRSDPSVSVCGICLVWFELWVVEIWGGQFAHLWLELFGGKGECRMGKTWWAVVLWSSKFIEG